MPAGTGSTIAKDDHAERVLTWHGKSSVASVGRIRRRSSHAEAGHPPVPAALRGGADRRRACRIHPGTHAINIASGTRFGERTGLTTMQATIRAGSGDDGRADDNQ